MVIPHTTPKRFSIKYFLLKLRTFWWREANVFSKEKLHRNDSELEYKRRIENPLYIDRYGYKVYSQCDEDGIIQEIFNRIGTTNRKFVEFGVQNGLECNTHFLLHKGWEGVWIEANKKHFGNLCKYFEKPIQNNKLKVINAFITIKNCSAHAELAVLDQS